MSGALEAALLLAAQGFPVFPCGRSKRPALQGRGFHDATTDSDQVRAMFGRAGDLVGCPTGAITGFDVLDVDPRHHGDLWEQANFYRLPETRIHRTPGLPKPGDADQRVMPGTHYLFRHAPGVRNTASKIAPGIDLRGDGGYVIMPPSAGYSVLNEADIAEWPDWLLDLVLTAPPEPKLNGYHRAPVSSRRLDGFIRSVCGRVAGAGEGAKHYALRNAALSLGGIQAAAGLSEKEATDLLLAALPRTVKDWKNAGHTIAWGLAHGRNRPIELEDREPPRANGHAAPPPPEPEEPREFDTSLFELVYFEDIQPNLDAADFVEDLLIRASMAVVYGESNCGKTFFMTDLALHIAMGKTWRGREIDGGGVIYCALEGSHGISNRVAAFRKHHGLEGHRLPFAIVPSAINMLDPKADTDRLIASILDAATMMGCPVKLVVIDTLSRAMAGGNENAPDDMGALVMNTDRVRQATGAAVVYVHHSGKDAAKGARGHSLLRAATDTEIEVIADGAFRMATVVKQRELECSGEFPFHLEVVDLGTNRRGKAVTSCVVTEQSGSIPAAAQARRKLTGHAQRAYEVLVDLCGSQGQSGHPGTPSGVPSVPEDWWRERFYERTPGDTHEAKRQAFRRASVALVNDQIVGMANSRVWIIYREQGA